MANQTSHFIAGRGYGAAIRLLTLVFMGLALTYWRFGYSDIQSDLLILDLKGIYQADITALRGDWFTEAVPQPHWIYDGFVEFFDSREVLAEAKVAAWILTGGCLAIAVGLLAFPVSGFAGAVLVLLFLLMGPYSPLGSAMLALGWTIPHLWGGALALLAFAFRQSGQFQLALLTLLMTPFAHSQHGLHLGLVFVMLGIGQFLLETEKGKAIASVLAGIVAMVLSLWVAHAGGVAGLDGAYDRVCQVYVPFHCFTSFWPGWWWLPLPFMIGGVALYLWQQNRANGRYSRSTQLGLGLIFTGYLFAMAAEYFQIPVLSHLARIANIWRWVSFFAPLACLGYAGFLASSSHWFRTNSRRCWFYMGMLFCLPAFLLMSWFSSYSAHWQEIAPQLALGLACGVGLGLILVRSFWPRWLLRFATLILALGFIATHSPSLVEEPLLAKIGAEIQRVVPPGEILLANPADMFVRRYGLRGVIADFKGIPYSEPYLSQWETRLGHLGWQGTKGNGYDSMTYVQWILTARLYQARYALVRQTEGRFAEILKNHVPVGQTAEAGIVIFRLNL